MKPLKSSTLAMLLGLLLVTSAAATAQTTSQADQKKACCSMESCCCCGDSCDVNMMKTDATMKRDMKHDAKGDCCRMKQKTK